MFIEVDRLDEDPEKGRKFKGVATIGDST
jgi:hypothetical protein